MSLSSVPAVPSERTGPRSFEEVVSAVYNDRRADLEQRELLLAMAYALYASGKKGADVIREARRVLGSQLGIVRYDKLMWSDVPRYEAPREAGDWGPSNAPVCEAPRLRPYKPRPYTPRNQPELPELPEPTPIRPGQIPPEITALAAALKQQAMANYAPPRDRRAEDGMCGAQSHLKVIEKDPRTGWVTAHWFCKRHKEHADRVAEQVRAQNEAAPEPAPNRGGLLPCYFKADWEKVYRGHAGEYWEPPKYGVCADDWPTPGEMAPGRGRLRMVVDGDEIDWEAK